MKKIHYLNPTNHSRAVGRFYMEKLLPWVRNIRWDIFRTEDPPFDSIHDGMDRIKKGKRNYDLSAIERFAYCISEQTGFSPDSCYEWIMCGTEPILPPGYFTISDKLDIDSRFEIHRAEVQITLNTTDVTDTQLRAIRKQIRQALDAEYLKLPDTMDYEIMTLVLEMGGVPKAGKTHFWECVRAEWNRRRQLRGEEALIHNAWQATRMKYVRAETRYEQRTMGIWEGANLIDY